jgi:hypothetical protein
MEDESVGVDDESVGVLDEAGSASSEGIRLTKLLEV